MSLLEQISPRHVYCATSDAEQNEECSGVTTNLSITLLATLAVCGYFGRRFRRKEVAVRLKCFA